jgi:hypothetical protein
VRARAWPAPKPEISRFYGIIITINYHDHLPPHFHARYGDDRAAIMIDGAVLAGSLPRRALALVRAWASQHRPELLKDWELARAGQALDAIAPLD